MVDQLELRRLLSFSGLVLALLELNYQYMPEKIIIYKLNQFIRSGAYVFIVSFQCLLFDMHRHAFYKLRLTYSQESGRPLAASLFNPK